MALENPHVIGQRIRLGADCTKRKKEREESKVVPFKKMKITLKSRRRLHLERNYTHRKMSLSKRRKLPVPGERYIRIGNRRYLKLFLKRLRAIYTNEKTTRGTHGASTRPRLSFSRADATTSTESRRFLCLENRRNVKFEIASPEPSVTRSE